MAAIPLHIISGFLGSGKTTFLKQILATLPSSCRVGVVQNEFAPANIDGREIIGARKGIRILEVNNGSVFCVCLLSGFAESLRRFLDEVSPSLLVLEASGLSDTTSLGEMLEHPLLAGRLFLAANWCIVDALNFARVGRMLQRVVHQVRMADRILLNKSDLAAEKLPMLEKEIAALNPFATLVVTTFCQVPFDPAPAAAGRLFPDGSGSLGPPGIQTMVIRTTRPVSEASLREFLAAWAPLSYRIKGYVLTGTRSKVAVQCTQGQTVVRQAEFWPGPTELVALTDHFTLREWRRSFARCHGNDIP